MKYELFIQNESGAWVILDMNESPAMNYQINNLAELKDRQMSYSQNIKLPITPNNCRALGFVDIFEVDTSIPYEPRPCRLLCDGINIGGTGSILYVDRVSLLNIECQILSGTTDLIEKLSNLALWDVDYNTVWNGANVGTADLSARWQYLLTTVDKGAQLLPKEIPFNIFGTGSGGRTRIDMRYLFPAVPFRSTVEYILNKQGYSLVTDLDDFPQHRDDYITPAKANVSLPFVEDFNGLCSGSVAYPLLPQPHAVNMFYNYIGDDTGKVAYSGSFSPEYSYQDANLGNAVLKQGCVFTADAPTKLAVDMSIDTSTMEMKGRIRGWIAIAYTTLDGTTPSQDARKQSLYVSSRGASSITFDDIELAAGEKLMCGFIVYLNSPASVSDVILVSDIEFKPSATSDEDIAYGDTINVLSSLGFKNQGELLKTFLQVYGLTMDIDHTTKTVYAYTMNTLYKRRDAGDFYDWTRKLILDDENRFGFRLSSYAQNNYIKQQDNTDDDIQDRGNIPVADKTLESTKDLFTLPFEAGRNLTGKLSPSLSITIANLPVFKTEIPETEEGQPFDIIRTYAGGKAHIVTVRSDLPVPVEVTENGVVKKTTSLFPAQHAPAQTYVNTYYSRFKDNMLKRSRTVELSFLLNPWDVERIDFFRPVWIGNFRAFFYISKISNFIEGQPTKVSLVCLGVQHEPEAADTYYSMIAKVADGQEDFGEAVAYPTIVKSGGTSTFIASPKDLAYFDHWEFSDGSTTRENPAVFNNVTKNLTGTALFKKYLKVTATQNDRALGFATVSPQVVMAGETATFEASTEAGGVFQRFDFDDGTSSTDAIVKKTITQDLTGTAIFTARRYFVTVLKDNTGTGNGVATASPLFGVRGTEITFTATPADGSEFAGWVFSDGTTSNAAVTVKTLLEDLTATAKFNIHITDVDFIGTVMPKNGYWGVRMQATPDIISEGVPVNITCSWTLTPAGGGEGELRTISGQVDSEGWLQDTKPYDESENLTVSGVSGSIDIGGSGYAVGTIIWS